MEAPILGWSSGDNCCPTVSLTDFLPILSPDCIFNVCEDDFRSCCHPKASYSFYLLLKWIQKHPSVGLTVHICFGCYCKFNLMIFTVWDVEQQWWLLCDVYFGNNLIIWRWTISRSVRSLLDVFREVLSQNTSFQYFQDALCFTMCTGLWRHAFHSRPSRGLQLSFHLLTQ